MKTASYVMWQDRSKTFQKIKWTTWHVVLDSNITQHEIKCEKPEIKIR